MQIRSEVYCARLLTDRHTDKLWRLHNLLGGGKKQPCIKISLVSYCYNVCNITFVTWSKRMLTGREVSVRPAGPCQSRWTVSSAQPQLKWPLRAASQALDVEAALERRVWQRSLPTGTCLQRRGGPRRATDNVWTTFIKHRLHWTHLFAQFLLATWLKLTFTYDNVRTLNVSRIFEICWTF